MSKLLKNIRTRHYVEASGLLIVDLIFFASTNTNKDPSFVVIIGFALLIMSIYILSFATLGFFRLYGLPLKELKRPAIYITILLSLLIALQSIGELTPKDVLVLLPIIVIAYVYTGYKRPKRSKSD
jgi:hypothetical protein